VALAGDYAYVADGPAGLLILGIQDPLNPAPVGNCDTDGQARKVALSSGYAYVADDWAGLQVINVNNPAAPVRVGGYDSSGETHDVALSGIHAFLAEGSAGLQVLDVRDPAEPRPVGGCATGGIALGVAVSGNYAYVAAYDAGLRVIDIGIPAAPVAVRTLFEGQWVTGVTVSGRNLFVALGLRGLWACDLDSPATPRLVAACTLDASGWASRVALAEGFAYVADWQAGLQIIRVDDPSQAPVLQIDMASVGGTNGVRLTWPSVANRLYSLQGVSDLRLPFANLQEQLPPTPPQNEFWIPLPSPAAAAFYRVRVE